MSLYTGISLKQIASDADVPYTYLLCMMYELERKERSEAFYYNQLDITYLPIEVINILWPVDPVSEVIELFWHVYSRVEDMEEAGATYFDTTLIVWECAYTKHKRIGWTALVDCWIFKTVLNWVNDETIELKNRTEIKKVLFDALLAKQSNWD